MSIRKVMLLGADGTLGKYILPQLLKGDFEVIVLKRVGSKSPDNYPPGIKSIKTIDDAFETDDLVKVLTGQDAIILCIKGSQIDLQKRVADACVKAGVKRMIPADFGSCDSSTAEAQELVPLFKHKTALRDYLDEQSNQHSAFTYTSLVAGHFFDWLEFVKIELKGKRITILDDGEHRASYSTRNRIGEATRHVLERPDQTANKTLFIQSFCVTQNEVVAAVEKATNSKWTVIKEESKAYEQRWVAKRDEGDTEAVENLVWYLGVVDGNWPAKEGFAMQLLELQDENLQEIVDSLVR